MRPNSSAILDALPAQVAVLDSLGRITEVNKAWRAFAAQNGLEPAKVGVGCDYLAVCERVRGEDEADAVHVALAIRRVLRGEISRESLAYPCHSPRERRWFRVDISPVALDSGPHVIVMHHDVTELRELEESMSIALAGSADAANEDFFGSLCRQMAGALGTKYAFVGKCLGQPPSRVGLLGAWAGGAPGALFEYDMRETPCENVVKGTACRVSSRVTQQYPADKMLADLGAESYVGLPVTGSRGNTIGLVVVVDVKPIPRMNRAAELMGIFAARAGAEMERRESEHALRSAQQQKALVLEMADDGIVTIDAQQRFVSFNKGAERMFGYTASEVISQPLNRLIPDRPAKTSEEVVTQFGESGIAARPMGSRGQIWGKKKDGSEFPAEASVSQVIHDGQLLFTAIVRDVTRRFETERKLKDSEEMLRAVLENAPAYVTTLDRSAKILFINRSETPAYSREQLAGRNLLDFLEPESQAHAREALSRVFERCETAQLKVSARRPDKSVHWFAVRIGPICRTGAVDEAIWVAQDITEHLALESQLRQSQKMESIGRLAGGIAHDFNNLLTAIMGHAELIAAKPRSERERDHARQIIDASKRAAELTSQLLAFSRKQVLQPRRVNLNDVVQEALKLLARLLGENVSLKTVLARALSPVMADPSQLGQVLINLAVNSRDAMPQGGSLTIETCDVELSPEDAARHAGVSPGPHVQLCVSDTGVGISPETMAQIFEPFFTTKPQGKGTGLGLAMVHGIVKQSGGHIFVYSEPGRGTSFKLYFPAVEGPPERSTQPNATLPDSRGTERVLLVEDDAAIRELACEILAARGYVIVAAACSKEAIAMCQDPHPEFDLLVTDVILPDGGGRELAEHMKSHHPALKVLFMSGYTDNAIVRHGVLDKGMNFLQKPFNIEQLAAKVREVLDAASG